MNIPGSLTFTDVTYRNRAEPVVTLSTEAGYHMALTGPLAFAAATLTGLTEAVAYSYRYRVTPNGAFVPVTVTVPMAGVAGVTFGELLAQLNTDLAGIAAVDIDTGEIRFTDTSAPLGTGSYFEVADGTVAPSLFGGTPLGADRALAPRWFQGLATPVKGVTRYARWNLMDEVSKQNVYDVMQFADPADTEWTRTVDSVRVTYVAGPNTIKPLAPVGIAAGTYDLNVAVDGVGPTNISFVVRAGMSFQQLMDDAIQPAVLAVFPAASVYLSQFSGTELDIVVRTGTWGAGGLVAVTAGTSADIIAAIAATAEWAAAVVAAVVGVNGVAGTGVPSGAADPAVGPRGSLFYNTTSDLLKWSNGYVWDPVLFTATAPTMEQVLTNVPCVTGFGPLFTSSSKVGTEVASYPVARGEAFGGILYFDAVALEWRYFAAPFTATGLVVAPPGA